MRPRLARLAAGSLGVLAGVSLVLATALVINPLTNSYGPLVGDVVELGSTSLSNCRPQPCPAVTLSLRFTSPAELGAEGLRIVVTTDLGKFVLPNGSAVNQLILVYSVGFSPHWLVNLGGNNWTSLFTATFTNPNGQVLGGPGGPSLGVVSSIRSPATVVVTGPAGSRLSGLALQFESIQNPGDLVVILS